MFLGVSYCGMRRDVTLKSTEGGKIRNDLLHCIATSIILSVDGKVKSSDSKTP